MTGANPNHLEFSLTSIKNPIGCKEYYHIFLRVPDNSNLFRFPLKVRVIVSRLYLELSPFYSLNTVVYDVILVLLHHSRDSSHMSHVFSHSNRKRNKCLLDLPGEAREAGEDWIRSDLKMADNNVAGSHRQSYCMR